MAGENTLNYNEHGGSRTVIGGSLDVTSTGEIDIESGGAFKVGGVDVVGELPVSAPSATVAVAADVLAIPVTHKVVTKTTGADAEALTLANGVANQVLTVVLTVDGGGDGTITPATCTGFATIVLADAGDHVTLKYINDTVGWVILGTAGVAAPPAITV